MTRFKWYLVITALQFAGLWAATQYVAANVGDADAVWCWLYGRPLYAPWSLLLWQMQPDRPAVVYQAMAVLLVYAAGLLWLLSFARRSPSPKVKAFGTDGWGTWRDMKKAGLRNLDGTVVGIERGSLLTYAGPEHQLVAGASRSGKGVGHVVPTLLCWPHSALVYDVKGELWDLTAGFRSACRQHCLLFNPVDLRSGHFNPLLELRKGPHEVRDAQNLVEMLINPDGGKPRLDVWDQNAFQFLTALVLHVLYTEPPEQKNLGRVRDLLLAFDSTCEAMMTTPHRFNPMTRAPEVYPEIGRVARSLLSQAEKFRSSVRGTAEGYLTLWADDVVREVTRHSDFALGDLACLDRPVTLYLQPPPSDANRVRPLVRLLLNQVFRTLMERMDHDTRGRPKRHRLLLLLDEFPTLGKLDFFSDNLRQMAGYGLKAHLIVQSFNDIVERYGAHNSILDNCHLLACFGSADTTTAERISKMAGEVVEYRESYSEAGTVLSSGRRSVNRSEHVRPLLSPGQVRTFPQDRQLIFVNGFKPFRTDKLRYYEHPELCKRVLPPPDRSAVLRPKDVIDDWRSERPKAQPLPLPEGFNIPCEGTASPPGRGSNSESQAGSDEEAGATPARPGGFI